MLGISVQLAQPGVICGHALLERKVQLVKATIQAAPTVQMAISVTLEALQE